MYTPIKQPYSNNSSRFYNGLYIKFILLLINGIVLSGLVLLILFMNGTLWATSSVTNYQYNATGIGLTILFSLLGLTFDIYLCLCFLVITSKPTFTQESLELLVHTAVNDFNTEISKLTDDQIYASGSKYFNEKWLNHRSVDRNQVIFATKRETKFTFLHKRFMDAYPELVLENPKWGINNVGGIYARQQVFLFNFKEYICNWGTELAQSGGTGFFVDLNEGDIVTDGFIRSAAYESRDSLIITYKFGDTSRLENGQYRHFTLSENCYMISFGLYKNTKMWRVFYNGLIMPYLFQNGDSKSFQIQFKDALRGIWKWILYRIAGGG